MPYNPGAIVDKAGNLILVWEINDDFTVASPFNSFNVGHIANSSRELTTDETEFKNELGETVAKDFAYTLNVTGILMQSEKALIDFMSKTVKGKRWGLYYKRKDIDGKTQEWFYAGGTITPQHKVDSPGGAGSMPFKFTGFFNESAVILSTSLLASIGAVVTITQTIPANEGFILVET